jgi:chemotaxis family two-component system response regulator Rcp1
MATPKPIIILMAEDSPTDAELAKEAFENGKLVNELIIVPNGVEAMAFVRKEGKYEKAPRPDIIMLDLNMPMKDGRQVLVELKQDPQFKAIPVVVLTTSSDEADVLKSYELQASCFVTKPMDFDKFLEVAKQIRQFFFSVVTLPPNGDK